MIYLVILEILLLAGAIYIAQRNQKGRGISILVPFHCSDKESQRTKNWLWLKKYWRYHLPGAQIVMGNDPDKPFSKSVAVNDAAALATGDVFVIADADAYISIDAVLYCVEKIREARRKGQRQWFIPYRQFYRLTQEASQRVLNSPSSNPYVFPDPPCSEDVQNTHGSGPRFGHWYGAMIQIMPREAFEEVGGWDERFRGWGGEDHAAMRAMDTLYWKHKTLPGPVFHIWHPMLSPGKSGVWIDWKHRIWEGQEESGVNDELSHKYYGANGDRTRMRKLVDEGLKR